MGTRHSHQRIAAMPSVLARDEPGTVPEEPDQARHLCMAVLQISCYVLILDL